MPNLPQPVTGSVACRYSNVSHELEDGFYLDEDVALQVAGDEVVVIAPDSIMAKSVVSALSQSSWSWKANIIEVLDLNRNHQDYIAWLALMKQSSTVGVSTNESRERKSEAKTV